VVDFNGTQAAIRAGYSAKTAKDIVAENLSKPHIKAEIARLTAEYARAAGIDRVWVLERIKAHVDAKLPDLFNDKGELLAPQDWPEHMKTLVDKVKVVQKQTGTVVVDSNGTPIHVPMYTKEVSIEAKGPMLAKLLDFVVGIPPAPPATQNFQVNVDKLLMQLDRNAPVEKHR
jgi:Terminase small subunit